MMNKKKLIQYYVKTSTPEEIFADLIERVSELKTGLGDLEERLDISIRTDEEIVEIAKTQVPKPKDGENGKSPTKKELKDLIKLLIPEPKKGDKGDEGVAGNKMTSEEVIEKIKLAKGKKRLSIFDLKDWEWLREKGKDAVQWASAGFKVYTDATLTGDGSSNSPLHVVTTGSGFSVLVPTSGAVNSANLVFTFAVAPSYILADGIFLRRNDANGLVQWSGTNTITMINPPSTDLLGIQ